MFLSHRGSTLSHAKKENKFLTYFNFRSAEERKEEGNQLYKSKKYVEALQKYSQAIELCPENPAFYGNRAACLMMLSQYHKALDDAKTAVALDSNFVKGYVRIAKCCIALGELSSAKQVNVLHFYFIFFAFFIIQWSFYLLMHDS